MSDLGVTEEEADEILNKDEFLSNTSSDFDLLKKKGNGSMVEFEEISRNLLNSDFDSNRLINSMEKSGQISDKELDHLLSSGFKDLSDVGTFQAREEVEVQSSGHSFPTGGVKNSGLSGLQRSSLGENCNSQLREEGGSTMKQRIERAISIDNSIEKANNTSDLNVLMSEIGEFDTGNFFGGSDAVVTSQGVLTSNTNLDSMENTENIQNEVIPEAVSDEDSDGSEGDFIDRRSRVEKVKPSPKEEAQSEGPVEEHAKEEMSQSKEKGETPSQAEKQA